MGAPEEPQSQTKIFGTLPPNAVFLLLARLLVLSMLFTAVNSPNLAQGKRTVKCPNNFETVVRVMFEFVLYVWMVIS